ncbi:SDR family oxidoreductase [Allohahella marinimesophila]|uniref:SDR family oxidoreductase n=1 Tax=Allohahella marinimesophila TaxID=1054972 RepID=A0ABP7NWJ1_9GAMM
MNERTLVIGSSGNIGKLLVPMLAKAGIPTVAMVRDKSKLERHEGIEIVEADLEKDFGHVFEGCNRVVFCAGSGPDTGLDKTFLVDLWGARKAVAQAKKHGVEQFVMVSSMGAGDPEAGPQAMRPYLIAKHLADEGLIQSGVPYTILRPGQLTDVDGSGRITTTVPEQSDDQKVPREDVASVILETLRKGAPLNEIVDIYQGEEAIEKAIG